jgi:non-specific serine/threonine protein kinase
VLRAEGGVAACRGRHPEADRHFSDAVELALGAGSSAAAAEGWLLLGLSRGVAGRNDEAEDAVHRCLRIAEGTEEPLLRSYAVGLLGLTALGRGEVAAAADRVRRALQPKVEPFLTAFLFEVLAWTALADGDGVRAATLVGAADRLWQTEAVDPAAVPTLVVRREERLAAVKALLGARQFRRHVEQGASMARRVALGYALEETMPGRGRPDEVTPLTGRELEVAELVGRGMTNREVAAALDITVRTTQGHVEHILRKLGFGSRTQVAAWVAERRARQA